MTIATGDGSLADKLGASTVEVTHNYVAVIDASPMTPKITAFDSTGGTMTVRWEKYERSDFQHYTLYKMCSSNGYSFDDCKQIQINSRGQNFWNDVDYVGDRPYRHDRLFLPAGGGAPGGGDTSGGTETSDGGGVLTDVGDVTQPATVSTSATQATRDRSIEITRVSITMPTSPRQ